MPRLTLYHHLFNVPYYYGYYTESPIYNHNNFNESFIDLYSQYEIYRFMTYKSFIDIINLWMKNKNKQMFPLTRCHFLNKNKLIKFIKIIKIELKNSIMYLRMLAINKNDECPITLDKIQESELYMSCHQCKYNFSKNALFKHLHITPTCPMCRYEWKHYHDVCVNYDANKLLHYIKLLMSIKPCNIYVNIKMNPIKHRYHKQHHYKKI